MEAGEIGESAGDPPRRVAAEKLLHQGWWRLTPDEKRVLSGLIRAGLTLGVNPNFARLGLRPTLVTADTSRRESLRDIAGDASYSFRSYYSSSLHTLTLAVPPMETGEYAAFWRVKEREGRLSGVRSFPLQELRFLTSPVDCFDEESRLFDFSWDSLPKRHGVVAEPTEAVSAGDATTLAVVNSLILNPAVDTLGEVSVSTRINLDRVTEAVRGVREYPLGWGFRGADPSRQAGLLLLYVGLSEGSFGPLRASVMSIPYAAVEAWGAEPGGNYVYFAELVVPAETLAETTEYVSRVSSRCSDRLTYGFYDPAYLEQDLLPKGPAANHKD